MTILKNNVIHELVGLNTEIVKSSNNEITGKTGIIINETKNMFLLKTKFGLKQIPKHHNSWKFIVDNNQVIIDGNTLTKRPHDIVEIVI